MRIILNVIFLFLFVHITEEKEKLVFVYSQFSHGARGPLSKVERTGKDLLGHTWKHPSDLSAVGLRQLYLLGYYNRKKYNDFLPKEFDPHDMYVVSSDLNRTIESAMSVLQGLFPPGTGPTVTEAHIKSKYTLPPIIITDEINEEIEKLGNFSIHSGINKIPIHVFNKREHRFLLFEDTETSGCKNNTEVQLKNLKIQGLLDEANNFYKKYGAKVEKHLKKIHGNKYQDISKDVVFLHEICDTFISDYYDGRDLSDFYSNGIKEEEFFKDCKHLSKTFYQYQKYGDKDKNILHMSMSPILNESLSFLERKIEQDLSRETKRSVNDYSHPKYVIVSGHDFSLIGLYLYLEEVFGFDTKKWDFPVFATSLYFELYRKDEKVYKSEDDYFVEIVLDDEVKGSFPYKEFKAKIQSKLWTEERVSAYCEFEPNFPILKPQVKDYFTSIVSLGVISVFLLFANIFAYKTLSSKKKKKIE